MECPFCAEKIKDEAIACKHCSRDLRVVRPVLLEIEELAVELETLRHELDSVTQKIKWHRQPQRAGLIYFLAYILAPAVLLVAAHVVVTIVLDINPIYLRLASLVIPLPFGLALYALQKVRIREALLTGACLAVIAISAMLTVTGIHDNVPILPGPWVEWREVIEYAASITLAFDTGHILGLLIFQVLPMVMVQGGKPNAFAFTVARALGQHVGTEHLRRRARLVQDLITTLGPMVGILATAGGSVYAGLKGILGW